MHAPIGTFDRFMAAITQQFGDPTFSILKAHLIFEEILRTYLERRLPNAKAIAGARLTFAQTLALVRALQPPASDGWEWEAVAKLNALRNQFAHHLSPSERDSKISEYVTFVVARSGHPLPEPAGKVASAPADGGPFYQAVDMVNAGLFTVVALLLGFREDESLADLTGRSSGPPSAAAEL